MNIKRIIHIGIVAESMAPVKKLYQDVLGLSLTHEELYEGKTDIAFLPVGDSQIELIASRYPNGEIAQQVAEHGEGIHHIAFEVEDLEAALAELKEKGIPLVDEEPRPGAHGTIIAFIDSAATHGVSIELVQPIH